jgi:hypothetical protein
MGMLIIKGRHITGHTRETTGNNKSIIFIIHVNENNEKA